MTITPDQLVNREVFYCVSTLISELCRAETSLGEQAMGLAMPIDDYESAAIEEGWEDITQGLIAATGHAPQHKPWMFAENDRLDSGWQGLGWRELCEEHDIEPQSIEPLEFWVVSNWLAEKLEAKGERVNNDFAGLTVWARTTSGQAISQDHVIQQIHAELIK